MDDAHAHTVEEILGHFKVDREVGLNEDRVSDQRNKFGWNGVLKS